MTSFNYIYKRLHIWSIYTQSIKKIEGHFWYPVPPHPIPNHPIPSNKNNWTPFRLCSAESLRGIKSLIFKITPGKCVSKANFYTHQKKSHVPTVILKFLTTTPNLTSNFETWHQILKPIRILVKTLIICIGSCIHYLCTVKV